MRLVGLGGGELEFMGVAVGGIVPGGAIADLGERTCSRLDRKSVHYHHNTGRTSNFIHLFP